MLISWNNWHQHTQGNKSAKEYVEKFDEFLIRYNTLHKKSENQILFRFKVSLRDDLRTELFARRVNELETVYAFVQDLDSVRTNHTSKIMITGSQCLNIPHLPNPIGLIPNSITKG